MRRFPDNPRPNIDYPTQWTYTVIGVDRSLLEHAISEVVQQRSHKIVLSNLSSKGRYVSLSLKLIVLNEEERRQIYEGLRDHPGIKIVL